MHHGAGPRFKGTLGLVVNPVVERVDSDARAIAAQLEEQTTSALGHASLGDAVWRDLDNPGPGSAGFVARVDGTPVGYLHVARSDTFAPKHWALGAVIRPGDEGASALATLLSAAVEHMESEGGGEAVIWRFDPDQQDDAACSSAGFLPERELFQMRAPLPLSEPVLWPADITVRAFRPGHDEAAWLEVNNRAFRNHPEQGDWIEATLARRMAEPWFDPDLFLLAFDSDGLAGFNWLKVHSATAVEPVMGEIFVIGVDPRMQGSGLGRALTIAGLEKLSQRNITIAVLYVAGENAVARRLYKSLGFVEHRRDRAYKRSDASG